MASELQHQVDCHVWWFNSIKMLRNGRRRQQPIEMPLTWTNSIFKIFSSMEFSTSHRRHTAISFYWKITDKLFTSLSFMTAGWVSSSFASPLSTIWNVIVLIHSVRDDIIIVWSDVYAIHMNAKLCVFQWRRLVVAKYSFLLLCSKPIGRAEQLPNYIVDGQWINEMFLIWKRLHINLCFWHTNVLVEHPLISITKAERSTVLFQPKAIKRP